MRLLGVAVLVVALSVSGCVSRTGSGATPATTAEPVARATDEWETVTAKAWAVEFALPKPVDDVAVEFPYDVGGLVDGYAATPAPGMRMEVVAADVGGRLSEDDLEAAANYVPYALGAEGAVVRIQGKRTIGARPTLDAKITYYMQGDTVVLMTRLIGSDNWLYMLSTTGPTADTAEVTAWQSGLTGTLKFR